MWYMGGLRKMVALCSFELPMSFLDEQVLQLNDYLVINSVAALKTDFQYVCNCKSSNQNPYQQVCSWPVH